MIQVVPFTHQAKEETLESATLGDGYAAEFVVSEVRRRRIEVHALVKALRNIVDDAKDEDRADMRDSVDEQFIEEARHLLEAGPNYDASQRHGEGKVKG